MQGVARPLPALYGTDPRQDGPPSQSPRPSCSLCARSGEGSGGGVSLGDLELGPARPRLRRPGVGDSLRRGGGAPSQASSLKQFPWQRSPRQLRETPDPSSLVRVSERPPRPTWSPKKAECSRLSSPKSPMEPRPPRTSPRPALGRSGKGGGRHVRDSLRLRGGTAGRARSAGPGRGLLGRWGDQRAGLRDFAGGGAGVSRD